jgi:hypothetical protein
MAVNRYRAVDMERSSRFLLEHKPDVMLTHWIEDTHSDHAASTRFVTEALLHCAVAYGLDDVEASRVAFSRSGHVIHMEGLAGGVGWSRNGIRHWCRSGTEDTCD